PVSAIPASRVHGCVPDVDWQRALRPLGRTPGWAPVRVVRARVFVGLRQPAAFREPRLSPHHRRRVPVRATAPDEIDADARRQRLDAGTRGQYALNPFALRPGPARGLPLAASHKYSRALCAGV